MYDHNVCNYLAEDHPAVIPSIQPNHSSIILHFFTMTSHTTSNQISRILPIQIFDLPRPTEIVVRYGPVSTSSWIIIRSIEGLIYVGCAVEIRMTETTFSRSGRIQSVFHVTPEFIVFLMVEHHLHRRRYIALPRFLPVIHYIPADIGYRLVAIYD
jgi:hypothetical protein